MFVHSYPQKPDLLALTSAVAMDIGEEIQLASDNGSVELPSLPDVLSTTSNSIPYPGVTESRLSMESGIASSRDKE